MNTRTISSIKYADYGASSCNQLPNGIETEYAPTVISYINESGAADVANQWGYVRRVKLLLISTVVACLVIGSALARVDFFYTPVKAESLPKAIDELNTSMTTETLISQTVPGESNEVRNLTAKSIECLVSDRYPPRILKWCGLISENASRRGLPPDLVAAVILQESGGNPNAYSQSGAVGLMQVMPSDGIAATFMCVSGPCFARRPSSSELKDPGFNIAYGTKMLAGLVSKSGSLREGLKSYGPMDVGYYYADKVMGLYQQYRK